jgi:uncharacterized protein YegP (UPF0339 family)
MATATRQFAGDQLARGARTVGGPEPMEFLVFEDNSGAYRWTIVAGDGEMLAQSGGFTSRDRAEQAAQCVRDRAGSARLDRGAGEVRLLDGAVGRDGSSDELDAERWLDEGGSFSSKAVAR